MSDITVLIEDRAWQSHPGVKQRLKRAARTARKWVKMRGTFTLLLTDDEKLRALNRQFRGRNKPTNVLSFCAKGAYRGDIAIAYGVTCREAKARRIPFADHACHLVVHGVLHLCGYDHKYARDAKLMESLEAQILEQLGIADPYAGAQSCKAS